MSRQTGEMEATSTVRTQASDTVDIIRETPDRSASYTNVLKRRMRWVDIDAAMSIRDPHFAQISKLARRAAWSTRTLSWLILGESSSKERFAVVDAVPTPTPTPLLDAIRARAEICVLRTTLSAEMACGVCAANVRCLELERVCMRIDLVLSSSIDHTVSFYDDSDVLTPSLFSTRPLT